MGGSARRGPGPARDNPANVRYVGSWSFRATSVRYAKPATTFDEQADLLLKRGMIGDRATLIARLSFVNYYRLSAYWWPFRKPGPTALERLDEFIEGTEFTTVWTTTRSINDCGCS